MDIAAKTYYVKTLRGRSSQGYSALAWSPDGNYLAAASENAVFIWDVNTTLMARTYEHSARVNTLAWSPDSFYVASSGHGKIIQIWLANTGELKSMWRDSHFNVVNTLAWSPDGHKLVAGDLTGELLIWDTRISGANRQAEVYAGHTGEVLSVAWSPNGRYLASGGSDETVRVWKAPL